MLIPSLEISVLAVLILLLLLGSAMVSGSEVAYFSLKAIDYDRLRNEQSRSAQRLLLLKERPRALLATILIANNFINISIVIVSEMLIRRILPHDLQHSWAEGLIDLFNWSGVVSITTLEVLINFLITVVLVTFLLVLFGEVVPKVYARINNIQLAKFMSAPLTFCYRLFYPLSQLLVKGTNIIEKRIEMQSNSLSRTSKEDIDKAIDLTVSQEKNAQHEVDLLKSIVKFGDVSAKQIMRSRVDVIAVDFRINLQELLEIIKSSGYSRIPVYEDDFDNITGILYVKDLIGHLDEKEEFEWQELIRTNVLFIPESKKINELLKDFQSSRMHLAIVVDEYGGTSGIVTLEDIMEEVIGEIRDETDDEPEVVYKKIDDFNYLFEGKTLLNDVCRVIGVPTDTFDEVKGEADSIAGLILETVGFIPSVNRVINFKKFKLKVAATNDRRIEKVLVTLLP